MTGDLNGDPVLLLKIPVQIPSPNGMVSLIQINLITDVGLIVTGTHHVYWRKNGA